MEDRSADDVSMEPYDNLMKAVEVGDLEGIDKYYNDVCIIESGEYFGLVDEYEFLYVAMSNNQLESFKKLYYKSVYGKNCGLESAIYELLTKFTDIADRNEFLKFAMTEWFGPDIFKNNNNIDKKDLKKLVYEVACDNHDKFKKSILAFIDATKKEEKLIFLDR